MRELTQSRVVIGLAAVAASVALTGCASMGVEQAPEGVEREMEALRAAVVALQQKSTVTELELQRLRVKVAELELAERPSRGTAPAPARPQQPIAVTQTGPEDPIEPGPQGKIVITDLEPELVLPPSAVEPTEAAPDPPPSQTTQPPANTAPSERSGGAVLTAEAQALYDEGYTQYNRRQFVAAEATFQRFLQRFPNTSLADNAQYWIAESRYSRGDARGALASFRETVARYPEGNKAPDALLRAGRLFEELGDENAALDSYRELVRRFPESADALLAEDRIKALLGA